MPARTGQVEFIEDLLEKVGLTREELAELADEPLWLEYEMLRPGDASDVIVWLQGYSRRGDW